MNLFNLIELSFTGGTQLTTATEKATENVSKVSILESSVPPEFMPLIENLKTFIEQQKHIRDNGNEHYYSDAILEIGSAISDVLKVKVNKIEIDLQRSEKLVENLKKDTNRLLNNGELAHRISKTQIVQSSSGNSIPGSNQNNFINSSVHQYFNEIVDSFRAQMKKCEAEISTLKSYCESSNDKLYSYEEITQIMRKQHDNFVLLSAKVYAVHEYANHLRSEEAKNKDRAESTSIVSTPSRNSFGSGPKVGYEFEGPSPFSSAKNYVAAFQK